MSLSRIGRAFFISISVFIFQNRYAFNCMTSSQTAFLLMLTRTGNITASLRLAGSTKQDLKRWKAEDDGFSGKIDQALAEAESWLVYQAWRRAIEGVKVPYFFQGRRTGFKRVYSDRLLLWFLAKTNKGVDIKAVEDGGDSAILRAELATKLAQLAAEFDTGTDTEAHS